MIQALHSARLASRFSEPPRSLQPARQVNADFRWRKRTATTAAARRFGAVWLLTLAVAGCSATSGPTNTDMSSTSITSLQQRIEFLQRYVSFRRSYRELEFHISYHNNGGWLVAGPSDWDIRVVAIVPPTELVSWVPAGTKPVPKTDASWLARVPESERAIKITEWYVERGRIVGIDRAGSVVAYRCWTQ